MSSIGHVVAFAAVSSIGYVTNTPEVSDENIYATLKGYQEFGMIDYLPTEPLGEQWIVGWNGQILKFTTKEGIVGFLTGIQVCASFVGKQREPRR